MITPHAGEMAALLDWDKETVLHDTAQALRHAIKRYYVTAVLKGAETLIAQPNGATYRHQGSVIGLATGGSGDVLAGVIGGLLARGAPPAQAAAWAVYIHAAAGQRLTKGVGPLGFLARELLPEIPAILAALE